MDFTIGRRGGAFRSRIKLRHALAVTGIVLVAILVMTGGAKSRDGRAPFTATTPPPATFIPARHYVPQDVVVYIVGSVHEKEALERDAASWQWFMRQGTAAATATIHVIVIEPGQEESLAVLGELVPLAETIIGHGANLTLIDLR